MDKNEVKDLVRPRLKGYTITEVVDYGDAFAIYFVNDRYHQTGNMEYLEAGAGPIIFIKSSREIFETGSGQSAEQYLRAYREFGDIFGSLSETLEISGLKKGLDVKRAILDLKALLGISLVEAKKLMEKISGEGKAGVSMGGAWQAEVAKEKLIKSGFAVRQLWRKSC